MGTILAWERCNRCRQYKACTTTGHVTLCKMCAAAVADMREGQQLSLLA